MSQTKIVMRAADILAQAKAHAEGGGKPAWMGQRVYVGDDAVADWDAYESRQIGMGELASFGKLMGENHDLLRAIQELQPNSIAALSKSVGRAETNVSRTLAKLCKLGIVRLVAVEGSRAKRPELAVRKMRIELDVLEMTLQVQTPAGIAA